MSTSPPGSASAPRRRTGAARATHGRVRRRAWPGGVAGNERLTLTAAGILTLLLAAEGYTVLNVRSMLTMHMFIGLVLIPPVLVKVGSTGWRMVRYYAHDARYREKGPPAVALRLLAPVLVAATIAIFASGVGLLTVGHRSDLLLTVHKASFVVWGAVFAVHFLSYLPRLLRSARLGRTRDRADAVPGSSLRAMLVAASLGSGIVLAVLLLPMITGWHGGFHHAGAPHRF